MAESIQTDKNFLIVKTSNIEVVSIGGLGMCDSCNKASAAGYIIGALGGRWYCPECYEEWHSRATNYKEDREYEKMIFDRFCKILSVQQ